MAPSVTQARDRWKKTQRTLVREARLARSVTFLPRFESTNPSRNGRSARGPGASFRVSEDARDLPSAIGTRAVRADPALEDPEAEAPDERRAATRAARVLPLAHLARAVAGVDEVQAFLGADLGSSHDRGRLCVSLRGHLVVVVTRRHVPRDVGRDRLEEPRDLAQLSLGVVPAV